MKGLSGDVDIERDEFGTKKLWTLNQSSVWQVKQVHRKRKVMRYHDQQNYETRLSLTVTTVGI